VEKMCSAYVNVEAEDEQKAKELAESLKTLPIQKRLWKHLF